MTPVAAYLKGCLYILDGCITQYVKCVNFFHLGQLYLSASYRSTRGCLTRTSINLFISLNKLIYETHTTGLLVLEEDAENKLRSINTKDSKNFE